MKPKNIFTKTQLLLVVIFSLALFLRLYRLGENSPNLYIDETGGAYHSLFAIRSPVHNLGDFLVSRLQYPLATFVWFLGLNPTGVRLPSALYGSLFCLLFYLFAKTVSQNRSVALIAALLAAIIPWEFMLSRIGHTYVIGLVIAITLHLTMLLSAKTLKDHFFSLLPLVIAAYLYPSMVIVGPLAGLFVTSLILAKIVKRHQFLTFIGLAALLGLAFWVVSGRFGILTREGRGLDLAIWRDVNTPYEIDQYRALTWTSKPDLFSFFLSPEKLANKFTYNRFLANASIFTRNYLSFFSPNWLFLNGDAILRHSTGQVGAFYPFLIPFMLYGLYTFFTSASVKNRRTFLFWLIISPLPAAITKDGAGYLLRVVTMLPILTYLCALGIVKSFDKFRPRVKPLYGLAVFALGFYSVYYFLYGYFHVYPALAARAYEFGFKELAQFQSSHQNASLLVIWDGYYHNEDFRFWQNTPPSQYQSYKMKRLDIGESIFWQTFPNLYFSAPKNSLDFSTFIRQYQPRFVILPDRYFVKYPPEITKLLIPFAQIKYPDQTVAFSIYTVKIP